MRSSAARSRWAGPAPPRAGLSRDTQREATRALSLSVQSRRHRGDGQAARTPALGTHSPAPLLGVPRPCGGRRSGWLCLCQKFSPRARLTWVSVRRAALTAAWALRSFAVFAFVHDFRWETQK